MQIKAVIPERAREGHHFVLPEPSLPSLLCPVVRS